MKFTIIGFSFISYIISDKILQILKNKMPLKGKDYHKPTHPFLPSAMGLCTSISFITSIFILMIFEPKDININKYMAICSSAIFTNLLGFIDDVIDLEWRYKLIFPAITIIPTIILYDQNTKAIIPFLGLINIKLFYYAYMFCFSIFSTNAINILSGINGLEVTQIIVISFFMMLDNLITGHNMENMILCILISSSLPLYFFNKYPAKGFVGNNYCYFSGAVLSSIAIITHKTGTLYALMGLQLFNFIISIPQLVGYIKCPRHRMPGFDGGYLICSMTEHKSKEIHNLTVPNVLLKIFGKMKENHLFELIILMQIAWSSFVLLTKYMIYSKYLRIAFSYKLGY